MRAFILTLAAVGAFLLLQQGDATAAYPWINLSGR